MHQLKDAYGEWIGTMRPWTYFLTCTFRYNLSDEAAIQAWDAFVRFCQPHLKAVLGASRVEAVAVVERPDPLEPPHLHVVLYTDKPSPRTPRAFETLWKSKHGLSRVKPIRTAASRARVSGYIAKHYTPNQAQWLSKSLARELPLD